jgi:toxin ParE1/3/4
MPEMGVTRDFDSPRLAGIRMFPVRGFDKYLVFYRLSGNAVEIIRVLHSARDVAGLFTEGEDRTEAASEKPG